MRTGPVLVVCAALVLALTGVGVVWALRRAPAPDPAPTIAAPFTSATSEPAQATTPEPTPSGITSSDGLVSAGASVSASETQVVVNLLDRHFSAINQHDYASWTSTVVAQRAQHQPRDTWLQDYRSTTDESVKISAITETGQDSVNVTLSFISNQDVADAPQSLPVPRICWNSRWPIVNVSGGGQIGTPPPGTTSDSAC